MVREVIEVRSKRFEDCGTRQLYPFTFVRSLVYAIVKVPQGLAVSLLWVTSTHVPH